MNCLTRSGASPRPARVFLTSLLALAILHTTTHAADHRDSPSALAEPAADVADIYAWTTADTRAVNLVLTLPVPEFSDAMHYAIHVESAPAYGEPGTEVLIVCAFDAGQNLECWIGDQDYVAGDASSEVGLESASGRVRAFVGERDDPFFFNASGLRDTLNIVNEAAPNLDFDGAGCPILDEATSNALVASLQSNGDPVDNFAGETVGALVLQIDRELLNAGGEILAIWASTHRI